MIRPGFRLVSALIAVGVLSLPASAGPSIVVLNGAGTSNLDAPLAAAGFTVKNGFLSPGQIAANIDPTTVGVFIWNDGTLGNTGSPADPSLSFNAADQAALTTFNQSHPNFIMDS